MKIEELRQQLDSDARKRCTAQEKTIHDLILRNKKLEERLKDRQDDIHALQNRCFAMTHGVMCIFCRMRETCYTCVPQQGKDGYYDE